MFYVSGPSTVLNNFILHLHLFSSVFLVAVLVNCRFALKMSNKKRWATALHELSWCRLVILLSTNPSNHDTLFQIFISPYTFFMKLRYYTIDTIYFIKNINTIQYYKYYTFYMQHKYHTRTIPLSTVHNKHLVFFCSS